MDDLKRLLEASDGPRELTADEDRRLRKRLGLDVAQGHAAPDDDSDAPVGDAPPLADVEHLHAQRPAPSARRSAVRALPYLAAAAVLVVALVATIGPETSEVVVVSDGSERVLSETSGEAAATLAVQQTCTGSLVQLVDDIEAWGGIDLWSAVSIDTATPDLEISLLHALDGFARVAPTAAAAEIADELRRDLTAASEGDNPLVVKPARVAAVEDAAISLALLLRSSGFASVCDLDSFDAALAGDDS